MKQCFNYFGARYYDHGMYRFTSVDPIINKSEALTNPQLWNLYSYCRNNPITYFDPDGRDIKSAISNWWKNTPISFFIKGDFKGGFKQLGKHLSEQLSDPKFVLGFVGGVKYKTTGKFSKIFKGKFFPEKLNRGRKLQPFDKKGRFLPYSYNPGVLKSPFAHFSKGFGEGFGSSYTGAPMPFAVEKAHRLGQNIGQVLGMILGKLGK